MKTRRAFLVQPGRFELQELDVQPNWGEVLVKIAACGLCNWEQNHWKGLLGECPQSLGHEWAGTVVAVGDGANGLQVGDTVTALPDALSGFSDYVVARAGSVRKLAPSVSLQHALGEPFACVVNVIRAADPQAGDHAIIVGCGPMGLWCIQVLAGSTLNSLIAVDVSPAKLDLARRFGATHTIDAAHTDAIARIGEITDGWMGDFVIEGTGSPKVISQSAHYLKARRGRLAIMSAHECAGPAFDWRPIQSKGITVLGAHPQFSPDFHDDFRRAVSLLNRGVFQSEGLITHRFDLAHINEAFETLESKPADYIKGIVVPTL
jgi:threonine dehydrogenase-like Zn-dependent dehydrogenase